MSKERRFFQTDEVFRRREKLFLVGMMVVTGGFLEVLSFSEHLTGIGLWALYGSSSIFGGAIIYVLYRRITTRT
jgi:hypothetical protein